MPDGRMIVTFKYAAGTAGVPEAVEAELRRGHELQNKLVEIERAFEAARTAAWEEDPVVAPVLARKAAADEAADEAAKQLSTARQRLGFARKRKAARAEVRQFAADAETAREALAVARLETKAARVALREIKAERYPAAKRAMDAAREARDEAIKATYAQARDAGLYWANWADITAHHASAVKRVTDARKDGRPAQMRFRRFDGTGTVAVKVQREQGMSAAERARITEMKAAGMKPAEIAAATGRTAMAIARTRPEGPEKTGDPPLTPELLAAGSGKWRNVLQLSPALPADFTERPRRERRRLARGHHVSLRVGAAEVASTVTVPVVLHRPMPDDAEVAGARLTVTRCGPDREQHITFTAGVAAPAPRAGGVAAMHVGWRVLEDGSLRVAVIAGAGKVPPHLMKSGAVMKLAGDVAEVIVPAAWREEQARAEKLRGARDDELNHIRAAVIAWLDEHPGLHSGDGETSLPSPARVAMWRAPGGFAALASRCASGVHGDEARKLGDFLGEWAARDIPAWREEARTRRRLLRRRDDVYGQVAAWVTRDCGEVRTDNWDMRTLTRRPGPGEEADPVEAAARANRVLAAPGTLRERVAWAARRRGVTVTPFALPEGGAACYRCGEAFIAGTRRESIRVTCAKGHDVDQDVNMLHLMFAQKA